MKVFIYFLVFLLLVKGFSMLIEEIYKIPQRDSVKGLKISKKKENFMDKLTNETMKPIVDILAVNIKLSDEKEKKLNYELSRAGIEEKARVYYAKAIVKTGFFLLLPIMTVLLGMIKLTIISILIVAIMLYQNINLHKSKLRKKREEIEKGLPGFIRSILYKVNDSSSSVVKADLIFIFEDYLKVANPVFAWDISVLIMEMKTKDTELALRSFNNRLAIPEVGFLCNALIGLTRGEKQNETLSALAREMDVKSKENIRRELQKMPGKVFKACIPLLAMGFIAIGYVMAVALIGGMASLK